jgi:hypothetical protein
MMKEPYVKPEIKSEVLDPEALTGAGSPVGGPNDSIGVLTCPDVEICP